MNGVILSIEIGCFGLDWTLTQISGAVVKPFAGFSLFFFFVNQFSNISDSNWFLRGYSIERRQYKLLATKMYMNRCDGREERKTVQ